MKKEITNQKIFQFQIVLINHSIKTIFFPKYTHERELGEVLFAFLSVPLPDLPFLKNLNEQTEKNEKNFPLGKSRIGKVLFF